MANETSKDIELTSDLKTQSTTNEAVLSALSPLSGDETSLPKADLPVEAYAKSISTIVESSAFVHLIAKDPTRQAILRVVMKDIEERYNIVPIDGFMHATGSLFDYLLSALHDSETPEKRHCVIIDQWSNELIHETQVDSFRAWITKFHADGHSLILATANHLDAAPPGQRERIPQFILAQIKRPLTAEQRAYIEKLTLPGVAVSTSTAIAGVVGFLLGGPLGSALAVSATAIGGAGVAFALTGGREHQEMLPKIAEENLQDLSYYLQYYWRIFRSSNDVPLNNTESTYQDELFLHASEELHSAAHLLMGVSEVSEVSDSKHETEAFLPPKQKAALRATANILPNWFNPSELLRSARSFVGLDEESFVDESMIGLTKASEETQSWNEFLKYLAEYDLRITEETACLGFNLMPEAPTQDLALYLLRVNRTPLQFAVSLFRSSDLDDLFADFDPTENEPSEFLEQKFNDWKHNKHIDIQKVEKKTTSNQLGQIIQNRQDRPMRRLYKALVELSDERKLDTNLSSLEDYQNLVGPMEARFCEWVYSRLETRNLIDGLEGDILRASDVHDLAERLKIPMRDLKSLPTRDKLRKVLIKLNIYEPELPAAIDDGLSRIRSAYNFLSNEERETIEQNRDVVGEQTRCRQGLERLLKVIGHFIWDGSSPETREIIRDLIANGNYGLNSKNMPSTLHDGTAGKLNHLLNDLSKTFQEQGIEPIFLRTEAKGELWPHNTVFQPVNALASALNDVTHDRSKLSDEQLEKIQANLPTKIEKFLEVVNSGLLRVPTPIQFFRRHDDGHGLHYEGYTAEEKRLFFYEVDQEYELNKPYLFLSATNPSAVDMVCVAIPPAFQ